MLKLTQKNLFLNNFRLYVYILIFLNKNNIVHTILKSFLKYLKIPYKILLKSLKPLISKKIKKGRTTRLVILKKLKILRKLRLLKQKKSLNLFKFYIKCFDLFANLFNTNIKDIIIKNINSKNIIKKLISKKNKFLLKNSFLYKNKNFVKKKPLNFLTKFKFIEKITNKEKFTEYFYEKNKEKFNLYFIKNKIKDKYKRLYLFFKYTSIYEDSLSPISFFLKKNILKKKKYIKKKKIYFKKYKKLNIISKYSLNINSIFLKKKLYLLKVFYVKNFRNFDKILSSHASLIKKYKKLIYKTRKLSSRRIIYKKKKNFYIFKKNWFFLLKNYSNSLLKNRFYYKRKNMYKITLTNNNIYKNMTKVNIGIESRVFLSEKKINKHLLNFYYKHYRFNNNYQQKNFFFKKNWKIKKSIFLDFDAALLKKLKINRHVHWNFKKNGKLNERRYANFLKKEVILTNKNLEKNGLIFYFFQIFNRVISWNHIKLIFSNSLFLIDSSNEINCFKGGELIEVPVTLAANILFKSYKLKYKKYLKRIKKWSYLNYCTYINPKLKKKKNFRKF